MSDITLPTDLNLQESFDRPDPEVWMKLTEKVLNGAPFEKKAMTRTAEGITLQPVYDRSVLEDNELADTTPGVFPFIRGTSAAGYRANAWEVCQALPYPDPAEFNEIVKQDIARGQDSVLLKLDRNGRLARDPADVAGEEGTAVTCLSDLETALDGLNFKELPLHVDAGSAAPAVAAALHVSSTRPETGSICFDPLAQLAVDGELPMPLADARDLLAAHVTWMKDAFPGMRSVGVDVSWSVNAGGNAVQELALMLASAAETFRTLTERGVPIDLAAEKALVRMSVGSDYFMEVAKFRAARGLWAHLVKSCGGGEDAQKLCVFAATSRWHQTRLDPYVNLLRATSQAFSAVMGRVDGLRVDPFDAPFGLPNAFSRRVARNIQLILRDEAHLTEVVDPAGGSWTIENLTKELSSRAWAMFQDIEKEGGLTELLQDGGLRSRLKEAADAQRKLLAQRRSVKIGSNQFADPDEKKLDVRVPDTSAAAKDARARLDAMVSGRDDAVVAKNLEALGSAFSMEALETALKNGAGLAEAVTAIGGGQHARAVAVELGRLTSDYERLRERMDAHMAEHGKRPTILMAQMGPVRQHKIRSDFSQEFLKPGGFDIDASKTFATAAEAAAAVVDSGAAATVLCSTDDTYPELVPEFAKAVKAASPDTAVILAGLMPEHTDAFKASGVDAFIHMRADNLQLLTDLQALTGVAP